MEGKLRVEIDKIDKRCEVLLRYIIEYKKENNFERAMINDIKYRQLKMVSESLKRLL